MLAIAGITYYVVIKQPSVAVYSTMGWMIIVGLLLWWGNRQLTIRLDGWLPWHKAGNYRFFIHLVLALSYLLILVNLTYIVVKVIATTTPPTKEQIIVTNFWGVVLFIPVFSIYFSLHFLKHWRKSELEGEKIQKENIRSQLNSLRNQLDPHFLFNNLNILSSLIDTDTARSKLFIEKFADVYRALLRRRSDDLVPLTEELEFIDSYVYLLRTRFDQNIQFTINLLPSHSFKMIPPLSLQLLVENAIKHNIIIEGHPLSIHILQLEDDYLIVSNSLREKTEREDRKGSGLDNIKSRYSYFTEKEVRITKTESHFEVQIPLLEIEMA
jgi:hypothetical protein